MATRHFHPLPHKLIHNNANLGPALCVGHARIVHCALPFANSCDCEFCTRCSGHCHPLCKARTCTSRRCPQGRGTNALERDAALPAHSACSRVRRGKRHPTPSISARSPAWRQRSSQAARKDRRERLRQRSERRVSCRETSRSPTSLCFVRGDSRCLGVSAGVTTARLANGLALAA